MDEDRPADGRCSWHGGRASCAGWWRNDRSGKNPHAAPMLSQKDRAWRETACCGLMSGVVPAGAGNTQLTLVAVILTMVAGGILFALLGQESASRSSAMIYFVEPLIWRPSPGTMRGQLLVKAGAAGADRHRPFALCYLRRNVWNIGAEGTTYRMGAIFGGLIPVLLTGLAVDRWPLDLPRHARCWASSAAWALRR